MSKITACVAAVAALIAAPAFAADIPTKAPAPAPAPVYNWTGWYVGVNAGASMGNVKTDFNGAPIFWNQPPNTQITPGFGFSDTSAPSGFIGGGQIGYNWQYSPVIVVGLEADFQGALERDSGQLNNSFSCFDCISIFTGGTFQGATSLTQTSVTDYTTKIDWFGTVRARIGYVWGNGNVMSYLTGGLAYGEVKINGTNTFTAGFAA